MSGLLADQGQAELIACAVRLLAGMTEAAVAEGLALGAAAGLPREALARYLCAASADSAALRRALAPSPLPETETETETFLAKTFSKAHAYAQDAGLQLPLLAALAADTGEKIHADR